MAKPGPVSMFPGMTGATRRNAIHAAYFVDPHTVRDCRATGTQGYMLICHVSDELIPDPTRTIVEAHPDQRPLMMQVVNRYVATFFKDGYDAADDGSIHLQATDRSNTRWRVIGGGHRIAMWLEAARQDPTHASCQHFIKTGGFKVTLYSHDLPRVLAKLLVEELNDKNQLGASNSLAQQVALCNTTVACTSRRDAATLGVDVGPDVDHLTCADDPTTMMRGVCIAA